jgi:hypothetical protein
VSSANCVNPTKANGELVPASRLGQQYIFDPETTLTTERTLLEGVLAEGDLVLWIGREKNRKSSIVLLFAVSLATGSPFLTFNAATPLRVVILDYESKPNSLKRRYEAICNALALTSEERLTLRQNLRIVELRRYVADGNSLPKFPSKEGTSKATADRAFWEKVVSDYPADVYVIDPMRCLHAEDENDSNIEALLSMIRSVFKKAAVVIVHHMTKLGTSKDVVTLKDDMRAWSDGARGSGAIKAHADVIICQERLIDGDGTEVVYWGAFLKDAADIEPLALEESGADSFFWIVRAEVPDHLKASLTALTKPKSTFKNRADAANVIVKATSLGTSTAYRHVDDLLRRHLLEELADGGIGVKASAQPRGPGSLSKKAA